MRLLGFDATESASNACFERPEEWTGTGHGNENYIGDEIAGADAPAYDSNADKQGEDPYQSSVHYPNACSLRGPTGRLPASRVVLSGEPTARQTRNQGDGQGNGDEGSGPPAFVEYDGAPPVVAAADGFVFVGGPFVDDDSLSEPNENTDFLLNLWDDRLAGGATVLYDEGHGQPRSLEAFETFVGELPGHYTVEATADLTADLETADAVWLDAPREPFTDAERQAIQNFRDAGGVVFAHGEAAAENPANVEQLNDLADAVGAGVRFNADRLEDGDANAGDPARPQTANFPGQDSESSPNRYDNIRFVLKRGYYQRCGEDYYPDLTHWASLAGTYLESRLTNDDGSMKTVRWVPDPNQTMEDGLGRLLGYVYYDSTGDGSYDRNACLEIVTEGLGRTYHSAHVLHDEW